MAKRGRIAPAVSLTERERTQLESYVRSRSIINLSRASVGKWRKRYCEKGLEGLHDEFRLGRPRSVSGEKAAELIHKTLKTKPEGATHWSTELWLTKSGSPI